MKNYFDEKGNYINCENLSLAEIYHQAFALGVESTPIKDERKKGQWIAKHYEPDIVATTGRWFECSACGFLTAYGTPKFCMNCGSQMTFKEGDQND